VTPVDLPDEVGLIDDLDPVEIAAAFIAKRMKQCYDFEMSEPLAWRSNQLCNPDATKAHREGTGQEILTQMDGEIDAWEASIGTGGTMLGVAETLKETNPELLVAGVVPEDDPRIEWVWSKAIHQSLEKFGIPPMRIIIEDILERKFLDRELVVSNDDAKKMTD
jgi:cysteine synthase A